MKILVLGAGGNSGLRIVRAALAQGHDVTALARDEAKLRAALAVPDGSRLSVRAGDVTDTKVLVTAMEGQTAVVNAAGNLAKPEGYVALISGIIRTADQVLGKDGRFWLFGGAGVLDVPGTSRMTVDLPLIPKVFRAHRENLETVRKTALDWSMLCPGPMVDAADGRPHDGLRISADVWPVDRPAATRFLPAMATAIAFARKLGEMTITYEDAADVIVGHLARGGPYVRRRVGIALPPGMRGKKTNPF